MNRFGKGRRSLMTSTLRLVYKIGNTGESVEQRMNEWLIKNGVKNINKFTMTRNPEDMSSYAVSVYYNNDRSCFDCNLISYLTLSYFSDSVVEDLKKHKQLFFIDI